MKAKKNPSKTRLLKMTIDQDWAESMAACRHSRVDDCLLVSFHKEEIVPIYHCTVRPGAIGPSLCRLMGGAPCEKLRLWDGHESMGVD